MVKNMKKLAVIGCGGIGSYHLGHFLGFKDIVELAGFCDLIPERAESFVEQAGCGKAFTDYKVMLDEIKPDMVFVCVPPYCHGEIEFDLIERGIHFFVEKPLALDLDLARKIRDAAAEKNLITASGFQCRYSNLAEPNKKFCEENEIVFVDCTRIGGMPTVFWWRDKDISGGQIVEQTIHQFDIIRYVFGEPEEVFTYGSRGFLKGVENYNTDDISTTVVKYKNGTLGTISTGCYATNGNSHDSKVIFSAKDKRSELKILDKFEIFGDKPVEVEKDSGGGFVVKGDGALAKAGGDTVIYRQEGDAGILCDRTFIEAVISGEGSKIRSPYADAFKSLSFTIACNKSMETGLPVKVELE